MKTYVELVSDDRCEAVQDNVTLRKLLWKYLSVQAQSFIGVCLPSVDKTDVEWHHKAK